MSGDRRPFFAPRVCGAGLIQLWALAGAVFFFSSIRTFEPVLLLLLLIFALFPMVSISHSLQLERERNRQDQLELEDATNPKLEKEPSRISGWSVLLLIAAVVAVVLLATWAAAAEESKREITSSWGLVTIGGVCIAFIVTAAAPNITPSQGLVRLASRLSDGVRPLGRATSAVDFFLAQSVACAVGVSQPHWVVRYLVLAGTIIPLLVLGYWLPAPYGLAPLAWAFVVIVAVARRWAWVEDDREVAMLNRHFEGPHIRVGFDEDLRDEAMIGFTSMFFLVPLLLRQAHLWLSALNVEMFAVSASDANGLVAWIQYFGTELAKAVPFVDWAEVYGVHGDENAIAATSAASRHILFATRVIIDLVFLAALLQAISISAKTAKQKVLFRSGVLDRLDPFVEPKEFRKLAKRTANGWQRVDQEFNRFPKYNPTRLLELSKRRADDLTAFVVKELQRKNGVFEPHVKLVELAHMPQKDPLAVAEILSAIRISGPHRDIYYLRTAREELNAYTSMAANRLQIVQLISDAPQDQERREALIATISGSYADKRAVVREVALRALLPQLQLGFEDIIEAYHWVANNDGSGKLKQFAIDALANLANRNAELAKAALAVEQVH